LSPGTTCKLFRTGMNHLYIVVDGQHKFVFRVYTHEWRTREEIAEEVRLLLHLSAQGIPVAYPLAAVDGQFVLPIMAAEGMRYGVLFSFAEGKKVPRFTPEVGYQIGVAMAQMHRVTEGFELQRITYDAQTLLVDSLKRTQAFFTQPSDEMTFLENATYFLVRKYGEVRKEDVRSGAIHLDMWFDNMHFHDDGAVTFFDFDFCGNGWLCHDIGYFLYQLYSTNPDEQEYKAKAESFLQGYESVTPIPDEEKQLIPFVSLGVLLFYISIQCDRYDTWSNIFLNEDHLKRYVAALKRWLTYSKMVIE
jgi:Ser/Thr protein kinase RdoA (MazF antagonist)